MTADPYMAEARALLAGATFGVGVDREPAAQRIAAALRERERAAERRVWDEIAAHAALHGIAVGDDGFAIGTHEDVHAFGTCIAKSCSLHAMANAGAAHARATDPIRRVMLHPALRSCAHWNDGSYSVSVWARHGSTREFTGRDIEAVCREALKFLEGEDG